ncbi:hypothetical protein BSFA1_80680 (plasmid) [Burkholderia sp. SFA1]|nr:hypothetical protein BSFA1_80680 [Burkholderia sp. SFA1]
MLATIEVLGTDRMAGDTTSGVHMAEILGIDASRRPIVFTRYETENLDLLQGAVDGDISVRKLGDGRFLVLNEDGELRQLPLNALATALLGESVFGTVVLLTGEEADKYL